LGRSASAVSDQIKENDLDWYVKHTEKMRNAYKIWSEIGKGRELVILRYRWENNIRMNLRGIDNFCRILTMVCWY